MKPCPCGNKLYSQCCEPLITQKEVAESSIQLMKSRYSAFVEHKADYLFQTSSVALKQTLTTEDLYQACVHTEFVRLDIIDFNDTNVEFKAWYLEDDLLGALHEKSNFVLEDGEWKYDSGELQAVPSRKIKRNDLCPCGNNKKFKKCHGQ